MNDPQARGDVALILERIRSLEPFPTVATKVLSLSTREDVLPRELIRVIESDAATTAKVLKLCNSSYYGFRREVGSLLEAGNLLGVRALVDLVMTSCTARYFSRAGGDAASAQALWKRSVAHAWAAQHLALAGGSVDPNRAYTTGLLQDIGHLVADHYIRGRWVEIQERVRAGADLLAAEREELGLDHAEIGARLTDRWDLPEALVDAIRHHHTPEHATVDPDLAWYAHLADAATAALGLEGEGAGEAGADEAAAPGYATSPGALEATGFTADQLAAVGTGLREAVASAQELLAA